VTPTGAPSEDLPIIAVIGGGMAGLGAAYALESARREAGRVVAEAPSGTRADGPHTNERGAGEAAPFDWVLFEGADYLGGKVKTERLDGFVVEGGPDSFIADKPWPMELARRVGISDRLLDSNEDIRKSYVFSRGRLHELPEGLILMVPTRLVPFALSSLISLRGKLRMALDLVLPRGRPVADESLGVFVRRRLGREALAKVAEPIVAGIHAGDPEQMSVRATFPMFLEMEEKHRSLIVGMIRRRRSHRPAPATRLLPVVQDRPCRSGRRGRSRPAGRPVTYRRRRRGVVCGTCWKRRGQPRRLRGPGRLPPAPLRRLRACGAGHRAGRPGVRGGRAAGQRRARRVV
jgi:oxygen-dependent protoporphyrinogen oxidase